ncbi:diguanylate cyclase [Kineococcus glutinatus]|uniref:GGDEF domain-containing protein n=1 Tax=Kineococcus glutinatus TaxID=1070872 RepID=A0ABP9HWB8_9ACTN
MPAALGPRHARSARLWAAVVLSVTTWTSLLFAILHGGPHPVDVLTTVVLGSFALLCVVLPVRRTAPLSVAAPLLGASAAAWLDLATADAGVTGQVFFCLPVLWAAVQLRAAGAALVTAWTVACEALVVLTLLPLQQALTELTYMTAVLVLTAVLLVRAVGAHDRIVARLRRQAGVDPLTGLGTRRVLDDATRHALDRAGALGTALVVVDIDRFKAVNDTHGHLAGDAALAHVAGVLEARCREQDVVARMGGDELAVLMPGCPVEAAARRAEQFVAAVRAAPLLLPGGTAVPLSISAGVGHAPDGSGGTRDLYADADAALYAAKRGGRDRVGRVPTRSG